MREIKFRVYDTHLKTYTYNAHQYHEFVRYLSDKRYICEQFTGLTDKNGKEIFEGDMSRFNYVVKYCDKYACFALYDKFDRIMSYPLSQHDFPAIGNIHENPELL